MSNVSYPVEILDPASVSYEDALAAAELSAFIWPPQDSANTPADNARSTIEKQQAGQFQAGYSQWYVVRNPADPTQFLAKAQTFPRTIRTANGLLTILALAGVCTRPETRRLGLGSAVVKAAFARVNSGQFSFCYYQTTPPNLAFYERLGACLATNPVTNSLAADPAANPFWDPITMRYPATGAWPTGAIDLQGPGY